MLFAALAASPSRRGAAMAFRINTLHSHAIIRQASTSGTARFVIGKSSHEGDYNSMSVAELRELLRERGQPVSGIKATLVGRLSTGEINPRVGNKPNNKKKAVNGKKLRHRDREENKEAAAPFYGLRDREENKKDARAPLYDDGDVKDDLAGLIEQVKSMEGNEDSTKKEHVNVGQRVANINRMSRNVVFAKEGEEEDSDDEWDNADDSEWIDDDDDDEEDGFDPNKTAVGKPRPVKSERKAPERRTPERRAPERSTSDRRTPEWSTSDRRAPERSTSDRRAPERRTPERRAPDRSSPERKPDEVTFKEDFQGTRVFVQGLPEQATWKDVSHEMCSFA